jgi:hypothetical protein
MSMLCTVKRLLTPRRGERREGGAWLLVGLAVIGMVVAGCNEAQHPAAGIAREAPVVVTSAEVALAPAVAATATATATAPVAATATATSAPPVAEVRRNRIIETPEAARRLARAIASDVALYNAEEVEKARRDKGVSEKLAAEIAEGRELFEQRVEPGLYGLYSVAVEEIILLKKSGAR